MENKPKVDLSDLSKYGMIDEDTLQNFYMKIYVETLKDLFQKEGCDFKEPIYIPSSNVWCMRIPKKIQNKYSLKEKYYNKTKDGLIQLLYEIFTGECKKNKTLNEVYEEWLPYAYEKQKRKNRTTHTINKKRESYTKWIQESDLGRMKISKIDVMTYTDAWDTFSTKMTYSAKNELKTVLNNIWDYATYQGYALQNISRMAKLDIDTIPKKLKVPKSPEEREKLIEYYVSLDTLYGYALALSECLICRIGEIKALKWSDVNISDRYIMICHEITVDNLYVDNTKNKASEGNRILPLSDRAISILNIVKSKNYNFRDDFIFMGKTGKFISTQACNDNIHKACKELGIGKEFTTHTCRKYAATQASLAGMTDLALQSGGGWKDKQSMAPYLNAAAATLQHLEIFREILN